MGWNNPQPLCDLTRTNFLVTQERIAQFLQDVQEKTLAFGPELVDIFSKC